MGADLQLMLCTMRVAKLASKLYLVACENAYMSLNYRVVEGTRQL